MINLNNFSKKEQYYIKKISKKTNLIKISKPSRKIFGKDFKYTNLFIIRTSKGIISSLKGKKYNLQGEILSSFKK